MGFYEKQIETQYVYEGKILKVRSDLAELQNGSIAFREVVEHSGGVAVVPLTEDNQVLMVRQYRYPMEQELLELPAGKLSDGEEPLECAIRELSEETGCSAGRYVYLGAVYPSPGYCKETLYIYLALDLEYGKMHLDADELLSVETVALDELVAMVMANEIADAKTVIGILKTKRFLDNL